jgi:uncharacterized membrane protein required for colicin V production
VIAGIAWPDILIGAILMVGLLKGLRRGFTSEMSGAVALAIAIIAAFRYQGEWDAWMGSMTGLGPGSAHVLAMAFFAGAAYLLTVVIAVLAGGIVRLPILSFGNTILGGVVGALKAGVLVWAILYVALFFPLAPDLRADLHRSVLANLLTTPNAQLDAQVKNTLPWFFKPFSGGLFNRHKV